jgi:pantothenate kinase-related protein Tda10
MSTVKLKNGRNIKVVEPFECQSAISKSDAEMDERAVQAVKSAVNKANTCKKPIAKYDKVAKKHIFNMQMGLKNMLIKKPMMLILAGPNGSGKSTIKQYFENS